MLSRDQSLRPDTWNLLGHRETFLTVHSHQSIHHRHFVEDGFTLGILMLQMGTGSEQARRHLLLEVKNEMETLYQRQDSQGDRQPGILSLRQKEHIHRIILSSTKTSGLGASL